MPDRPLRILRETVELGTLPEAEARELLELGFLKPDDLFLAEGMIEARPLAELTSETAAKEKRSWLAAARQSVTDAAANAATSAETVAGKLKALVAASSPAHLSAVTNKLLDPYFAQIKKILASMGNTRPLQAIRSGVRDEETMHKVFGAAYDCLPRPVCRFVTEDRFIAYCMQHRSRLLDLPEATKEAEDK